jgi:hypothetical protein
VNVRRLFNRKLPSVRWNVRQHVPATCRLEDRMTSHSNGEGASIVGDLRTVTFPPNWRGTPFAITYAFLASEPTPNGLYNVVAGHRGDSRIRVVSPDLLGWSAVFNPAFFGSVVHAGGIGGDIARHHRVELTRPGVTSEELTLGWIQSVAFLASVTLSAAIIQRRFSPGTIASKYDRLWQVGRASTHNHSHSDIEALRPLQLCDEVQQLAADGELDSVSRLLRIRQLFEQVVCVLARNVSATTVRMSPGKLSTELTERFGFVDELRKSVPRIEAIVVYGSSVSSEEFADYDLVVVVEDAERALRSLAGSSPTWRGKELNIGVYDRQELWAMQLLSGDNLSTYGVCLAGEVDLPDRNERTLFERNFSFGMVRLRQQIGMIDAVSRNPFPDDGDDRKSLYDYFVKVPANVVRGTFGGAGEQLDKQTASDWLKTECGFDSADARAVAVSDPALALARSAVASMSVLRKLNERFEIVRTAQKGEVCQH